MWLKLAQGAGECSALAGMIAIPGMIAVHTPSGKHPALSDTPLLLWIRELLAELVVQGSLA